MRTVSKLFIRVSCLSYGLPGSGVSLIGFPAASDELSTASQPPTAPAPRSLCGSPPVPVCQQRGGLP